MPQFGRAFSPSGAGLEPEDLRGHVAVARGVEQEASYLGVRLRLAHVEFIAVMLAQRLGINADDASNVRLRDAVGGHCLNLPALRGIGLVRAASHVRRPRSRGVARPSR